MEQMTVPNKDLSDKIEDEKYEPFTFALKPDRHYEPDKAECRSSSSSSSSSTDSDEDDDFIQLEAISLTSNLHNPSPNNDPSAISSSNPNPNQLFVPTSQPVSSTPLVETVSHSDMPAAEDASRIPSSIFTSPSKMPTEWSVTSAESLFSINFSNSSLAHDNAILNNPPAGLPAPNTPGSAVSAASDLNLEGFGGPVVVPAEKEAGTNVGVVKENKMELGTNGGRAGDANFANSQRSDGSISSMQSFAFPVLAGDERTESIKVEPQSKPDSPSPAISRSGSAKPKPEPEPKLPPSSNSDQISKPPEPQVMASPAKEETTTVAVTTAAANDNANTDNANKTNTTTSMGSGGFLGCCCSLNS